MLTVISKDQTTADGKAKWICQCECGNQASVLSESLRNGSTKSCGCFVSRLKHDLTGMVFGHLQVLERTYDRRYVSKDTRWKCLCQNCGRTVSVTSYKLRTRNLIVIANAQGSRNKRKGTELILCILLPYILTPHFFSKILQKIIWGSSGVVKKHLSENLILRGVIQ
jgi:hypothetical protein